MKIKIYLVPFLSSIARLLSGLWPWVLSLLLTVTFGISAAVIPKEHVLDIQSWENESLYFLVVIFGSVRLFIGVISLFVGGTGVIPDTQIVPACADVTVGNVIRSIRERSKRLRAISNFILLFLVYILTLGVLNVSKTDNAGTRTAAVSTVALDDMIFDLREKERVFEHQLVESRNELEALKKHPKKATPPPTPASDAILPDRIDQPPDPASTIKELEADIEKTKAAISVLESERNRKKRNYPQGFIEKEESTKTPDKPVTTGELVRTIVTRITLSLLVFFLVQIFVSLYRYMVRLLSFYETRADSLQLATDSAKLTFEKLTELMSSDKLDFGRSPKTPIQQVLDATKQVTDLAKEMSK